MVCPFLLLFFGVVCGRVQSSVPQCRGIFDFYFVLDSSGSVGNHFQTEIIPFVQNVIVNFVNPNFRLSFITFATNGVVHLNLTSDRQQIVKGIVNLRNHHVRGSTNLKPGLQKVNEQIDRLGGDTASVILILTDGKLSDNTEADKQAQIARQKGASMFVIGVANADRDQLAKLVQNDNELFIGSNFQYLTSIINQVINDTCIEIISADPVNVCINQDGLTTTLTGQGFTNTPNPNTIACRFLFNETEFQITSTVGDISNDKITCSVPQFKKSQQVLLQVTLNGISYISSNVTMYVNDCTTKPVKAGLAAGLTFGLLGLIILIVLLLIWFFFPLITGKILSTPEPEPELEPEPEPELELEQPEENPGPKKWATVDASYYGGRGAGGIKPLQVHWGDKGATKEGNKLTATKDANILEMGEDVESSSPKIPSRHSRPSRPPRTQTSKPSCISTSWRYVKETASSFYLKVSLVRPVRGTDRTIIWFPFRQQDTPASRYKTPSRQVRSKLETTRTTSITQLKSTQQNSALSKTNNSSHLPPNMRSNTISSNREPSSHPSAPSKANTLSSGREPPPRPPSLRSNTPSSSKEPPARPPSLKSNTLSSGREPPRRPPPKTANTLSNTNA